MKNKSKPATGKKGFIVWTRVTGFLIVLLLVVTILTRTVGYEILCIVIGGERAEYAPGIEPIYTTEYKSKNEVVKAANKLNEEVCEEGFVLLKESDLSAHKPGSAQLASSEDKEGRERRRAEQGKPGP